MNDGSDKLLEARIGDMLEHCERGGGFCFSQFLDERQCAEAELICRRLVGGNSRYHLFGGHDAAARKILCIYEDYCEDYYAEEYPIKCLTFTFRREDKLTHRDFLGSLMGLRLKREVIGDIIIADGIAQAFVTGNAARLIMSDLGKIGRVGVKITDDRPFELEIKQQFTEIGVTVASLRLDCIVSAAARISREAAARLIRSEKVSVNHFPILSLSHEVSEGSIISVRGYGRFVLGSIGQTTKKERIHIIILKYI